MKPYWSDEWLTVYQGDCREVMRSMDPESVHCVVTSPPYWGLRDYGTPGQLGLEATPEEYVASMVDVFREVRRVLRQDGTVWLNLGDSYASGAGSDVQRLDVLGERLGTGGGHKHSSRPSGRAPSAGLAQKQLVGIPWRVAFALQADGWYLRSDIIWAKTNPMPESVNDRPTKSHEYLFLLSKSARYYYDADAVRERLETEPHAPGNTARDDWQAIRGASVAKGMSGHLAEPDRVWGSPAGRNLRSVWTIATQPYPGAHFATFPAKLVEPCVKAGTSERGVCPDCGAPWVRVVERESKPVALRNAKKAHGGIGNNLGGQAHQDWANAHPPTTTGWQPSCDHYSDDGQVWLTSDQRPNEIAPATVLDPFAGSGTTGMVAQSLGRRAILIDLSTDYLAQIMARNAQMPLGAA